MMIVVMAAAMVAAVCHNRSLSRAYSNRSEAHYVAMFHAQTAGDHSGAAYHASMLAKYQRAHLFPWLPVAPDPPEPE
jgi:hypothetical protein